jgi:hypothetical protein
LDQNSEKGLVQEPDSEKCLDSNPDSENLDPKDYILVNKNKNNEKDSTRRYR